MQIGRLAQAFHLQVMPHATIGVGISANSTFLGLGRAIQAPQANQYSLSYSAPYTSTVMANGDTAVTGAVKK